MLLPLTRDKLMADLCYRLHPHKYCLACDAGIEQCRERLGIMDILAPLTITLKNFQFLPPFRWLRFSYIVAIQYIHWR
jgi:hypothetical protein